MMKSVPPGHGMQAGQQATLLTVVCSCGSELRQGHPGATCKRCGGAIVSPHEEPAE